MKSLVLFLQSSSFTAATVEETCKSAAEIVEYSFCSASIQADPSSKNAVRAGLALVSADLSLVNTTSTVNKNHKIQALLKNATEASIKSGLEACSMLYSQAVVFEADGGAHQSQEVSRGGGVESCVGSGGIVLQKGASVGERRGVAVGQREL